MILYDLNDEVDDILGYQIFDGVKISITSEMGDNRIIQWYRESRLKYPHGNNFLLRSNEYKILCGTFSYC